MCRKQGGYLITGGILQTYPLILSFQHGRGRGLPHTLGSEMPSYTPVSPDSSSLSSAKNGFSRTLDQYVLPPLFLRPTGSQIEKKESDCEETSLENYTEGVCRK